MRETGDWLVPHLNGEIYSEKPPLFFWLSALGQGVLGFNAGRVVAGLASLGTLLLTWALARRFLTDRAALLGAVVLGTTVFFPWLSRFGVLDVVLTFFVSVAVYGWHRGGPWIVLFYAGMGLAVLTKGPVGIVLASFAAVPSVISGGRGGRPWHLLWGVPLTAGIVAAWLWPACVRGGPIYADAILWKQNVGRAVESWSHARPFWYYVPYLLWMFFPWVLFLPWAAPWAWRQKGFPRAMLLWAAIGVVFFSFVSGKRERYLTPLFPPLAIVVGAWLDAAQDALAQLWVRLAARVATGFLVGAALVLCSMALFFAALATGLIRAPHMNVPSPGWFLGALALAGLLCAAARKGIEARNERMLPRVAGFVALGMVILMLAADLLLVPYLDKSKSPRPVAEALNTWPGEVAAYPAHFSGAYNLYSGRLRIPVLKTTEQVVAHLAGPGKRLVLTSFESYGRDEDGSLWQAISLRFRMQGDLIAPEPEDPAAPPVWWSSLGRVGHREMLFVTNYAPP